MKNVYSNVNLNLFELDQLISLLEDQELKNENERIIFKKIYVKLENAISSMEFKEQPEKILKKQKGDYIKK